MEAKMVIESAKVLGDVAGKIGLLEAVKAKLVRQPDVAATKLVAVLEELEKSFLAFEAEVVPFLSITLAPGPDYRADVARLYELDGGSLWARVNKARGHCGKIGNLYDAYLNPWFQRVTDLSNQERTSLAKLFAELRNVDHDMVDHLNKATGWLTTCAHKVLEQFEAGKVAEANQTIVDFRKEILPLRRSLSKALAVLLELESDFISMSRLT